MIQIPYDIPIETARATMVATADALPVALDEPRPVVHFVRLADSGIELQLSVWTVRENFVELRNGLPGRVLADLTAAGIEVPFPHRVVLDGD